MNIYRSVQPMPILVALVLLPSLWGCGGDERPARPSLRRPAKAAVDTAEVAEALGGPAGERSPEELRQEFEALFSELRKMQADLERRQASLEMRSRRIRARELELSELEKGARRLRRTAYGVLAVGLITFVLGVVMLVISRRRPPSTQPGSPPGRQPTEKPPLPSEPSGSGGSKTGKPVKKPSPGKVGPGETSQSAG